MLADIEAGHNIVATVYLEWLSMYRAAGPNEMRPVGEVEFANGIAAMAASGTYGKTKVCAGIVGYADLMLGARVEPYLFAMEREVAAADLVVCRAGATTLAELTAAGRASILVPLPTATDDHQRKNAEVLDRAGAAEVIEQKNLTGDVLAARILALLVGALRAQDLDPVLDRRQLTSITIERPLESAQFAASGGQCTLG